MTTFKDKLKAPIPQKAISVATVVTDQPHHKETYIKESQLPRPLVELAIDFLNAEAKTYREAIAYEYNLLSLALDSLPNTTDRRSKVLFDRTEVVFALSIRNHPYAGGSSLVAMVETWLELHRELAALCVIDGDEFSELSAEGKHRKEQIEKNLDLILAGKAVNRFEL